MGPIWPSRARSVAVVRCIGLGGRLSQMLHAKCYTACSILLAELIWLCQALNRVTCDCATGCTINKTVLYTC